MVNYALCCESEIVEPKMAITVSVDTWQIVCMTIQCSLFGQSTVRKGAS